MNKDVAVVIFNYIDNFSVDLEIPLDITANDLVYALNKAYNLGIDISNIKECYLKSENPIALLRGNKSLREFGIRNGSIIVFNGEVQSDEE